MNKFLGVGLLALSIVLFGCAEQEEKSEDSVELKSQAQSS